MVGRKRKSMAVREPNGRVSRAGAEERLSPVVVKRLVAAAAAGAGDARFGSEVGRLLLAGDLTTRQASAGWRFSEVIADRARAIGADRLEARSMAFERGVRGAAVDPGSLVGRALDARDRRAVARYERAAAVLVACGALDDVRRLCEGVGASLVGYERLVRARAGLDALASLFDGKEAGRSMRDRGTYASGNNGLRA